MTTFLFLTLASKGAQTFSRQKVYCISTHTNPYLKPRSHHHPPKKQAILSTSVHRARDLHNRGNLADEFDFLRVTLLGYGYSHKHIWHALNPLASELNVQCYVQQA
jgi:hypothetical protein